MPYSCQAKKKIFKVMNDLGVDEVTKFQMCGSVQYIQGISWNCESVDARDEDLSQCTIPRAPLCVERHRTSDRFRAGHWGVTVAVTVTGYLF